MPSKCSYCGEEYEGPWTEHAKTCRWLHPGKAMPTPWVRVRPELPPEDLRELYIQSLKNMIDDEQDAGPAYIVMAENAKRLGLTLHEKTLRRIAEDEQEHYKWLKSMLEGLE